MTKPWPTNCVQIACSKPEHFNYATLRQERVEAVCEDCGCKVSYDSYSRDYANTRYPNMPHKLICIPCERDSMRVIKAAILAMAQQGYLSLQVPDCAIRFGGGSTEYEELPDGWFCRISGRDPKVGRESGYLYLTRAGYIANKEALQAAFSTARGHTWADFVEYAAKHFAEVEAAVARRIKTLEKKIEELKAFEV